MTVLAQHADPHLLDDPRTAFLVLRTAEFSDDAQVLDGLARSEVTGEVLRKIAHNPASAEHTLEHLIDLDQRWLTYPVTRRHDLSPEFIDRIARRLTDRNAIFHASSAPNAAPETLRYLASHPSAPPATLETVTSRIGAETVPAA
ncbi:hypothetical protein [Brachybacterium tyrofermentans]|uniref:hypothetical protein n=1 Tax=Brachybacterium tyrofermentans TaxID=47848 RepID=UPI003F91668E